MLVIMTIQAQQLPVAAVRWIIVMVVVLMVDREFLHVRVVELPRAPATDPRIHLQRLAPVRLLALILGPPRIRHDLIEPFARRLFRGHGMILAVLDVLQKGCVAFCSC